MTLTQEQLHIALHRIEPGGEDLPRVTKDDIPALRDVMTGDEPFVARRALSLAKEADADAALPLMEQALRSNDPVMRVTAAYGMARARADAAASGVVTALRDEDAGVRRAGLYSASAHPTPEVRATVQSVADTDASASVRSFAQRLALRLGQTPSELDIRETLSRGKPSRETAALLGPAGVDVAVQLLPTLSTHEVAAAIAFGRAAPSGGADRIILAAVGHPLSQVRAGVAPLVKDLPTAARQEALPRLLTDADVQVRQAGIQAARPLLAEESVRELIAGIAEDAEDPLRATASDALEGLE